MLYQVKWSAESERTFNQNIDYLELKWDNQVINNFLDRVDAVIEKIQSDPFIYPIHSKKLKIYKCVVTVQITIYFQINDNYSIDLLTFWNSYQNPKKLKF